MHKRSVGEILRLNISIRLWLVLTTGIIVLLVSYFCAVQYRDQIKFSAVLLGAAAAIYSAYYIGTALKSKLLETNREQVSKF